MSAFAILIITFLCIPMIVGWTLGWLEESLRWQR